MKEYIIKILLCTNIVSEKLLNFKEKYNLKKWYHLILFFILILFLFLSKIWVWSSLLIILFNILVIINYINSLDTVTGALKSLFSIMFIFIVYYFKVLANNNSSIILFCIYLSIIWFGFTLLLKEEVGIIINSFLIGLGNFIKIIPKISIIKNPNILKIFPYEIFENILDFCMGICFFSLCIFELRKYCVKKYLLNEKNM